MKMDILSPSPAPPKGSSVMPDFPFLIDKKYKAIRILGKGGAGEALLAKSGSKEVCVKLLNLQFVKNPDRAVAKFKKEFEILRKLNHPFIAHIFDFGFDAELKRYYYVCEFIPGQDFFKASQKTFPEDLEVLMVQALQALHYLHTFSGTGFRHNDIKSGNILISKSPDGKTLQLKLIDFGLAAFAPLQVTGGTASYMSPEQIVHAFPRNAGGKKLEPPDHRTDLYSLGVLWYYCATGQNPFFVPGNADATMQRHFTDTPALLTQLKQNLPEYWNTIILKLLAVHPEERYQSTAEVIQDLALMSGKPYSVIPATQRDCYIPESEMLARSPLWQEVRGVWGKTLGSPVPQILWITGSRGLGKSKVLAHLKSYIQSHEGRTIFLEDGTEESTESWRSDLNHFQTDFSKPTAIALDDADILKKSDAFPLLQKSLEDYIKAFQHAREWQTLESPPHLLLIFLTEEKFSWGSAGFLSPAGVPLSHFEENEVGLRPFTKKDIETLLRLMAKSKQESPPEKLIKKLYDHTDGNPFFVVSVLRTLGDQGLLFDDSGHWHPTLFSDLGIDFSRLNIPQNLGMALKENWKRLTKPEQEVLSWISVFHNPLSEAELFGVAPTLSAEALKTLLQGGVLQKDERGRFIFKSSFVARMVYETLTDKRRRSMHRTVALYLQKHESSSAHQVAYHQARGPKGRGPGGRSPEGKIQREALEHLAKFYEESGRWPSLLECCEEAPKTPEWILRRAVALRKLNRLPEALAALQKGLAAQPKGRATLPKNTELLCAIGEIHHQMGDVKTARKFYEKALKQSPDDPHLQNNIARTLLDERQLPEAMEWYKKARTLPNGLDNNDLGFALLSEQNLSEAARVLEEDIAYFQTKEDRSKLARTHYLLGEVLRQSRQFDAALRQYHHAEQVARKLKNSDLLMRTYNGMGATYLDRAEEKHSEQAYTQSLKYFERALALCQHCKGDLTRLHTETAAIYVNIATIHYEMKHSTQSRDLFEKVAHVLEKRESPRRMEWAYLCLAHFMLADIYRQQKNFETAEALLKKAQSVVNKTPGLDEHQFGIHLIYARLKRDLGEKDAMSVHLAQAQHIMKEKSIPPTPFAQRILEELSA